MQTLATYARTFSSPESLTSASSATRPCPVSSGQHQVVLGDEDDDEDGDEVEKVCMCNYSDNSAFNDAIHDKV